MKYIVEVIVPEYIEVEANSEEQAIEIVKNGIQDPRIRDFAKLQVCKEVKLDN